MQVNKKEVGFTIDRLTLEELYKHFKKVTNLGKLIGVDIEELSIEEAYRRFKKVVGDEQ